MQKLILKKNPISSVVVNHVKGSIENFEMS